MANHVFIAASLDGRIADRNGGLDWLSSIPNPDNLDFGYSTFMERIDAILMGRKTFETVCGFECDWPYSKRVFVLSNTLKVLPSEYIGKAELINGPIVAIVQKLTNRGYAELYIDGGETIQGFLLEDLIDEMTITVLPIVLGAGVRLFGSMPESLSFTHTRTEVFLDSIVQSRYSRMR